MNIEFKNKLNRLLIDEYRNDYLNLFGGHIGFSFLEEKWYGWYNDENLKGFSNRDLDLNGNLIEDMDQAMHVATDYVESLIPKVNLKDDLCVH
jgi:hypothetical protein